MLEPNLHPNTVANFQTQARLMMATGQPKSPLVASHQNYQQQQQQQPERESYLACYEDLSSIYRHHRKRPRSTSYSPFDSASPASSTATNTTADSLLGSSSIIFGSDLTASCNDSSPLSPPPLTFNLLSASPVSLDSVGPSAIQAISCNQGVCQRAASLRSVSSVECNESSSIGASTSTSSEEDEAEEASDHIGPGALLASGTREDPNVETEDDDEEEEEEEEERCCYPESRAKHNQEDERIFHSLILKEQRHTAHNLAHSMNRQRLTGERDLDGPILRGHLRQSLLSWMLHVCVQEQCQDEIFALATMILDKFLSLHPTLLRLNKRNNRRHHQQQQQQQQQVVVVASSANGEQQSRMIETYERELEQRQLVQFASCSLMLATKLRQTPRLSIRTLIEFSHFELPVPLTHDDLTLGERFMLDLLKWDIAGLVTPNEFLHELLTRKCQRVMFNFIGQSNQQHHHHRHHYHQKQQQAADNTIDQDDNQSSDDRRQHYLERRRQNHHHLKSTSNHRHHHQSNHNHRNHSLAKCKVNRVNRHTQILLELCMLDDHLSQLSPSTLAMASMAVAIYGLSTKADVNSHRLDDIVEQIYESTDRVNKLELMIEVAHHIEGFLQEEAKKITPFGNRQHD